MIFKDRADAGTQLTKLIQKNYRLEEKPIIVSLLRGGVIVGDIIAKNLSLIHLSLAVTKIPAPYEPELAIGALCFNDIYLNKSIIDSLSLTKSEIDQQIKLAKNKFVDYCNRFNIKNQDFSIIKNKVVILVDDGVATGSTAHAASLFLKHKEVKKVILCSPVAPTNFDKHGFDQLLTLYQDLHLSFISRFYQNFPQVEDEEVKDRIFSS